LLNMVAMMTTPIASQAQTAIARNSHG